MAFQSPPGEFPVGVGVRVSGLDGARSQGWAAPTLLFPHTQQPQRAKSEQERSRPPLSLSSAPARLSHLLSFQSRFQASEGDPLLLVSTRSPPTPRLHRRRPGPLRESPGRAASLTPTGWPRPLTSPPEGKTEPCGGARATTPAPQQSWASGETL